MHDAIQLPPSALATMTAYDLDTDASGEYVEQLVVGEYAYYKTPLRPRSNADVTTTLLVDPDTGTFIGGADPDWEGSARGPMAGGS